MPETGDRTPRQTALPWTLVRTAVGGPREIADTIYDLQLVQMFDDGLEDFERLAGAP